jgi:type IX secretion system substrate protein/beta-propeller repeat-containing protein
MELLIVLRDPLANIRAGVSWRSRSKWSTLSGSLSFCTTNSKRRYTMVYRLLLTALLITLGLSIEMTAQEIDVNSQMGKSSSNYSTSNNEGLFIENKGQWPKEAKFLYQGQGVNTWLSNKSIVFDYYQMTEKNSNPVDQLMNSINPISSQNIKNNDNNSPDNKEYSIKGHVVRLELENTRNDIVYEGLEKQAGYHNYFIGNDPSKHASNVGLYKLVKAKNVYKGIDARFYRDNGNVRYDFMVQKGADPNQIQFRLEGQDKLTVNAQGELEIHTSLGQMKHAKIFAYQPKDGIIPQANNVNTNNVNQIECKFKINANGTVGFEAKNYDKTKPLVIDPLVYATYLGGMTVDYGYGMDVDSFGNVYVAGFTYATDYPKTTGAYDESHNGSSDIFVTKFNSSGTDLIFSTYIGGSGNEVANALALDASNDIYITGYSQSNNYPMVNAYDQSHNGGCDVIVTKLNANGTSLGYSTYLGGSGNEYSNDIVVDASNNAYITGYASAGYPTTPGAYDQSHNGGNDLFVTRINAVGNTLGYSTYVGGSSSDIGYGIQVDASGNAYFAGHSYSTNISTTPGAYSSSNSGYRDIIAGKLNSTGSSVDYLTYIGGSGGDECYSLALDASSNVYLTGRTYSDDFPFTIGFFDQTYNGGYGDAYVVKMNSTGTALVYSTYIGGNEGDCAKDIVLDNSNNVFITGLTRSNDFPCSSFAYDNTWNGLDDPFVCKVNTTGTSLLYSTYYSAYEGKRLVWRNESGLDIVYLMGGSGSGLPVTTGSFDHVVGGDNDVFVAKLALNTTLAQVEGLTLTPNGDYYTLAWTASSTSGVVYDLYRTETKGVYGQALVSNITPTTQTDLTPVTGVKYYYVVRAKLSGVQSENSKEVCTTPIPEAPTDLLGTVQNYTCIELTWTASSTAGVTYKVFRGYRSMYYSLLASGLTSTTYTDVSSLEVGRDYYYVVVTEKSNEPSDVSNEVKLTMPAIPPTNLSYTLTGSFVNLSWSADTSDMENDRFYVYRSLISGQYGSSIGTVYEWDNSNHSFTDNSITEDIFRYYFVVSRYAWANQTESAYSNEVIVEKLPVAPTSLSATMNSGDIDLSWTSSMTSNVTYSVYRKSCAECTETEITTTAITSTTFTDTDPLVDNNYYIVRAEKNSLESIASNTANIVTPPTAPGTLTVTPATATAGSYSLSWVASSTPDVTYTVFKGTGEPAPTYTEVVNSLTSLVYTETGLDSYINYCYKVVAVKSGLESNNSNEVWTDDTKNHFTFTVDDLTTDEPYKGKEFVVNATAVYNTTNLQGVVIVIDNDLSLCPMTNENGVAQCNITIPRDLLSSNFTVNFMANKWPFRVQEVNKSIAVDLNTEIWDNGFRPSVNGFGFDNDETYTLSCPPADNGHPKMWLPSYYEDRSWEPADHYSNLAFKTIAGRLLLGIPDKIYPSWETWVDCFGINACYNTFPNWKSSAVSAWGLSSRTTYPYSCYGFAVLSLLYYTNNLALPDTCSATSSIPSGDSGPDQNIKDLIHKYNCYQHGTAFQNNMSYHESNTNPKEAIEDIITSFENNNPKFIRLHRPSYAGHALVPYKILKKSNQSPPLLGMTDWYEVSCYDCNEYCGAPQANLIIFVNADPVENYYGFGGSTTYEEGLIPSMPISYFISTPALSIAGSGQAHDYPSLELDSRYNEVSFNPESNVVMTNVDNKEISNTQEEYNRNYFATPRYINIGAQVNGFNVLRENNNLHLEISPNAVSGNELKNNNRTLLRSKDLYAVYSYNSTTAKQLLDVDFTGNSLSINNNNTNFDLMLIDQRSNTEHVIRVSNFKATDNNDIEYKLHDNRHDIIINNKGNSNSYDLVLLGRHVEEFPNLYLNNNETHVLRITNWNDLQDSILLIKYYDNDMSQEPYSVECLNCNMTNVTEEDNLNSLNTLISPNPVSEQASINYNVPEEGIVSIKLFSLLGERVGEIINKHHEKGEYQMTYDFSNLQSGIYLYKVRLNNFTYSGKIVIDR